MQCLLLWGLGPGLRRSDDLWGWLRAGGVEIALGIFHGSDCRDLRIVHAQLDFACSIYR
jgi:hypothetical protein